MTNTVYVDFLAYNKNDICMGIFSIPLLDKAEISECEKRAYQAAGEKGHVDYRPVQYVVKNDRLEAVAI